MRLLDDDGGQLDAEFDIEVFDGGVDIVLRARSGTRDSMINPDYFAALELMLTRLSHVKPSITRVVVDSRPARSLPLDDRIVDLGYPIELFPSMDAHALRVRITEGQRLVASSVDPASRGGNKHKRIRLSLAIDTADFDIEQLLDISRLASADVDPPGPAGLGTGYYDDPVDRTLKPMAVFTRDDSKLERALAVHADTQRQLALHLRGHGIVPRKRTDGEPDYDIAWSQGSQIVVAEVKSLPEDGIDRQLRIGVGQILHYRELLRRRFGTEVLPVLAVPTDPGEPWHDVCAAAGIVLSWPPLWLGILEATASEVSHP